MGWVERAQRKQAAKLKALERSAPTLHGTYGTDFATAPGWREIDMQFSLIPDVSYPPDWGVVRAIREIDPSFTWVWVKWIFRSPRDLSDGAERDVVFGRHGLARYVNDPHAEIAPMKVDMPSYTRLPKPNKFLIMFQGERRKGKWADLPGDYQPFNDGVLRWFKDHYGEQDPEEMKKILVRNKREAWERSENKKADEFEYMMSDIDKYCQKQLDNVSEGMVRDYLLGDKERKRKIYSR